MLYLYRFLILRSGELCPKTSPFPCYYSILFAQPGLAPSSSAVLLLHHRRRPHRSALHHARVGQAGQEEVAAAAVVVLVVVEAAAAGGGRGRVVVATGPGFKNINSTPLKLPLQKRALSSAFSKRKRLLYTIHVYLYSNIFFLKTY